MLEHYLPIYGFAFLLTLFITARSEIKLIPLLRAKAAQPIYLDGPSWHSVKKGTPTMGALGFILAMLVSVGVSMAILGKDLNEEQRINLILIFSFALSNAAIGFLDDRKKLKSHKNEGGLSAKQKLVLQFVLSVLLIAARTAVLGADTEITFAFGSVEIGILYYPITIFILLGMINSVNLTDGVDGLLASVTFAVAVSLFYFTVGKNTEITLISSSLIGATVGFLCFNLHPAKIFMGDTGSLFFGALLSSIAICLDNPILMILIGGVYAIEGISVVLQVISFKLFKKRIFKMAPIHHHLEKCNWPENRICIAGIITTFILAILAYVLFILR